MSDDRIAALEETVAQLRREVDRLEGAKQVNELQHTYGYYLDHLLFEEIVPLFTQDCELRIMGGIFRGTAGVTRWFIDNLGHNLTGGANRPVDGFLALHMMMQDVVHVSENGQSAQGRYRLFLEAGWHASVRRQRKPPEGELGIPLEMSQWTEAGLYENEFRKVDGVWKIARMEFRITYHADLEHGWAHTPPGFVPFYTATFPDDPRGPDEIVTPRWASWPEMEVLPFHYPNPVTGNEIKA